MADVNFHEIIADENQRPQKGEVAKAKQHMEEAADIGKLIKQLQDSIPKPSEQIAEAAKTVVGLQNIADALKPSQANPAEQMQNFVAMLEAAEEAKQKLSGEQPERNVIRETLQNVQDLQQMSEILKGSSKGKRFIVIDGKLYPTEDDDGLTFAQAIQLLTLQQKQQVSTPAVQILPDGTVQKLEPGVPAVIKMSEPQPSSIIVYNEKGERREFKPGEPIIIERPSPVPPSPPTMIPFTDSDGKPMHLPPDVFIKLIELNKTDAREMEAVKARNAFLEQLGKYIPQALQLVEQVLGPRQSAIHDVALPPETRVIQCGNCGTQMTLNKQMAQVFCMGCGALLHKLAAPSANTQPPPLKTGQENPLSSVNDQEETSPQY